MVPTVSSNQVSSSQGDEMINRPGHGLDKSVQMESVGQAGGVEEV